jgi:hypothetical protein
VGLFLSICESERAHARRGELTLSLDDSNPRGAPPPRTALRATRFARTAGSHSLPSQPTGTDRSGTAADWTIDVVVCP